MSQILKRIYASLQILRMIVLKFSGCSLQREESEDVMIPCTWQLFSN